jgi:hypothetical protein
MGMSMEYKSKSFYTNGKKAEMEEIREAERVRNVLLQQAVTVY